VPLEVVAFVPKRSNTLGLLCESLFLFSVVSTVIFLFVCLDIFSGMLTLKYNAKYSPEMYTDKFVQHEIHDS
jgi:hypothetical protein